MIMISSGRIVFLRLLLLLLFLLLLKLLLLLILLLLLYYCYHYCEPYYCYYNNTILTIVIVIVVVVVVVVVVMVVFFTVVSTIVIVLAASSIRFSIALPIENHYIPPSKVILPSSEYVTPLKDGKEIHVAGRHHITNISQIIDILSNLNTKKNMLMYMLQIEPSRMVMSNGQQMLQC